MMDTTTITETDFLSNAEVEEMQAFLAGAVEENADADFEPFADLFDPNHRCGNFVETSTYPTRSGSITVTEVCSCLAIVGRHTDSIL